LPTAADELPSTSGIEVRSPLIDSVAMYINTESPNTSLSLQVLMNIRHRMACAGYGKGGATSTKAGRVPRLGFTLRSTPYTSTPIACVMNTVTGRTINTTKPSKIHWPILIKRPMNWPGGGRGVGKPWFLQLLISTNSAITETPLPCLGCCNSVIASFSHVFVSNSRKC
jgi:hypothetical protein